MSRHMRTFRRTSVATRKPMWMVRRCTGFLLIPQVTWYGTKSSTSITSSMCSGFSKTFGRLRKNLGLTETSKLEKYCELASSCIPLPLVNTCLPWVLVCGQLCVLASMFWRFVIPCHRSIWHLTAQAKKRTQRLHFVRRTSQKLVLTAKIWKTKKLKELDASISKRIRASRRTKFPKRQLLLPQSAFHGSWKFLWSSHKWTSFLFRRFDWRIAEVFCCNWQSVQMISLFDRFHLPCLFIDSSQKVKWLC